MFGYFTQRHRLKAVSARGLRDAHGATRQLGDETKPPCQNRIVEESVMGNCASCIRINVLEKIRQLIAVDPIRHAVQASYERATVGAKTWIEDILDRAHTPERVFVGVKRFEVQK
jgi:hypothetical protein